MVTVHRVQWPGNRKRSNISSDYGKNNNRSWGFLYAEACCEIGVAPDP